MDDEKKIVTLLVEEGTKGDPIGSYGGGSRSRGSIVFLPVTAKSYLGKNVRVELQEIRADGRGVMMYRGVPAPDIYADRWRDNGDGTVSRLTIATDWLGEEVELGIVETKSVGTREGSPSTQSIFRVVWGNALESSKVEQAQIISTPKEKEEVENGRLVWRKIDESRKETVLGFTSVIRVKVEECEWFRNRFQIDYEPEWQIVVNAIYTMKLNSSDETGWEQSCKLVTKLVETPDWWLAEQEIKYPVCNCGRNRYDSGNPDEYTKCEKCREEEYCVRCGMQSKIKNISGRLICAECEPLEVQDRMIDQLVSDEKRNKLADEAVHLLNGEAVQREAGEIILKSTIGHIQDDRTRANLVKEWSGYAWYYFCKDGIYGSKLSPTALQIIAFLPQATGDGLIELVAWLAGYHKAGDCERYGDYYHRTQVKGEREKPFFQGSLNEIRVATKLRGSEPDRLSALTEYERLAEKLGESDSRLEWVREILFYDKKQDYPLALQKIAEVEMEEKGIKNKKESPPDTAMAQAMRKAGLIE